MGKRLISVDEVTGLETWHDYDPLTDETSIIHTQDCQPLLEINKAMANDTELTKKGIKQEFWLYASIPAGVQVKWLVEDGIDIYNKDHSDRVGKKLNDPEWAYLKTTHKYHKFK